MRCSLIVTGIMSLAIGCVNTGRVTTTPAPTPSISSKPLTSELQEPPPVVSGDPVTFVVFPELGYSVLIPDQEWVYEKYHTPEGSEETLDLIMGFMPRKTVIVVQTYWDSREEEQMSIYDIVTGRQYQWHGMGFSVDPEDYRVDDKGYFVEFEAVQSTSDGTMMRYWIVGMRLHRLPGAVVLVTGSVHDGHEDFMHENLIKVIQGIQPFRDQ